MYIAPKAKSGVYFTRNLNEANYNNGKWLLGYFYRDSKLSKAPYYPVTNFDAMLTWYQNNYPTYIEALGESLKSVDSGKMIDVMKTVAARGDTSFPRPSVFANEILNRTGYTFSDKVVDTLKAVGETAMDLGKLAWVASVLGLAVIAYIEFGPAIKMLFKKVKAV